MKQRYLVIAAIDIETDGFLIESGSNRQIREIHAATYIGTVLKERLESEDRVIDLETYEVDTKYNSYNVDDLAKIVLTEKTE